MKTRSNRTDELPFSRNYRTERVKENMKDERFFQDLAETFKALSDPTRSKIIFALCVEDQLCVNEIAEIAGTSSSATSHQLRLLRSMKLVKYFKTGRTAYYSLDDVHINNLFAEGSKHVEEKLTAY